MGPLSTAKHSAVVLLLYFSLALAIQFQRGSWQVELSGPDETSHFVNGLMVSEYLKSGLGHSPMAFAREYYRHYPKVAIGHWPPLFSIFLGGWFALLPPTSFTALLPIAGIFALLATIVFQQCRPMVPAWLAFGLGLLMLLLPISHPALNELMLEPPCALMLALAALAYSEQRFVAFGWWSTTGLLTKANAGAAALLPPFGVVLSRQWHLLRTAAFWKPLLIVAAVAGPWYLYARPWITGEWIPGSPSPLGRRSWNVQNEMLGEALAPLPAALILLAAGGWWIRRNDFRLSAWAALALAVFAFHTYVTPHGEARFYLSAMVPVLILTASALRRLPSPAAGMILAGLAFLSGNPLTPKPDFGIVPAVHALRPSDRVILIASRAEGEGAAISAISRREPTPHRYLLRAGKMLASSRWMGQNYRSRFANPEEVAQYLDQMPISAVILDLHPGRALTHYDLLQAALQRPAWHVVFEDENTRIYAKAGPMEPIGPAFAQELSSRLLN